MSFFGLCDSVGRAYHAGTFSGVVTVALDGKSSTAWQALAWADEQSRSIELYRDEDVTRRHDREK